MLDNMDKKFALFLALKTGITVCLVPRIGCWIMVFYAPCSFFPPQQKIVVHHVKKCPSSKLQICFGTIRSGQQRLSLPKEVVDLTVSASPGTTVPGEDALIARD